jgi:hypothetical protein
MISSSPRPQAECLQRLQRLLPAMAGAAVPGTETACPAVDSLIDRIIGTCAFLQRSLDSALPAPPSQLDQSRVLSLAKIFANLECRHARLTQVMEKVLFYVKQHAAIFMCCADSDFVEALLSSLLAVPSMRRNVADTVIGVFKQMSGFPCHTRAAALCRLSLFLAAHPLPKDFLIHPSSHVVPEVLVRHIR